MVAPLRSWSPHGCSPHDPLMAAPLPVPSRPVPRDRPTRPGLRRYLSPSTPLPRHGRARGVRAQAAKGVRNGEMFLGTYYFVLRISFKNVFQCGENCPSDVPAPVKRHTASSQEARAPHAPGLLCNHGEKYTQNPPASNPRPCQGQLLDPACARADDLDLYDMEKEGLDLLQLKNVVQENIPQELQISDIRNRLSSPAGHSCLGQQQKFKF
ncbi:uncharacterized protein LOC113948060 isoform X1 [Corapipo altera]|uniref:uncharacterized protein LOC113948060 isoform X1 n=1 Tax=Corapipo altera TaxID=415028 RepID=UPI000FD6A4F7|nr:uncharacterized protein LOC113948060 isoform X1 [Corapipo altera]